jgi:hypothetical protein
MNPWTSEHEFKEQMQWYFWLSYKYSKRNSCFLPPLENIYHEQFSQVICRHTVSPSIIILIVDLFHLSHSQVLCSTCLLLCVTVCARTFGYSEHPVERRKGVHCEYSTVSFYNMWGWWAYLLCVHNNIISSTGLTILGAFPQCHSAEKRRASVCPKGRARTVAQDVRSCP